MAKVIITFMILWCVVVFGISYVWHATRSSKIDMMKTSGYGLVTGVIAAALLFMFVTLF